MARSPVILWHEPARRASTLPSACGCGCVRVLVLSHHLSQLIESRSRSLSITFLPTAITPSRFSMLACLALSLNTRRMHMHTHALCIAYVADMAGWWLHARKRARHRHSSRAAHPPHTPHPTQPQPPAASPLSDPSPVRPRPASPRLGAGRSATSYENYSRASTSLRHSKSLKSTLSPPPPANTKLSASSLPARLRAPPTPKAIAISVNFMIILYYYGKRGRHEILHTN